MYYSAIGAIAFMVLFIQNHDILFKRSRDIKSPAWRTYRGLLYAALLFHTTDIIWGVFLTLRVQNVLFVDTLIYFIAMAMCVGFWTRYAITYLGENDGFAKWILYSGRIFSGVFIGMVCANLFVPVIFSIDKDCEYHTTIVRWIMHIIQILLLIIISIYTFASYSKKKGTLRKRYRTVGLFGLIVSVFLFVMLWFPLLPLYSVAYLLGLCMLHSFVVNDEKEEYKNQLEQSLDREKQHLKELQEAREATFKDLLTGVKSKGAYVEFEAQKDIEIRERRAKEFAIAVFDINGLKKINDTFGHKMGDEYIKNACRIICDQFKHSPVFRVGGDEFVALLESEDYENRKELEKAFIELMEQHKHGDQVVAAIGMAEYMKGEDYTFNDVFARAERNMFVRKRIDKGMPANQICVNCKYEANCPSECEYSSTCKKI
jgi:diguanylate cyclase (GGDEF)-like protein